MNYTTIRQESIDLRLRLFTALKANYYQPQLSDYALQTAWSILFTISWIEVTGKHNDNFRESFNGLPLELMVGKISVTDAMGESIESYDTYRKGGEIFGLAMGSPVRVLEKNAYPDVSEFNPTWQCLVAIAYDYNKQCQSLPKINDPYDHKHRISPKGISYYISLGTGERIHADPYGPLQMPSWCRYMPTDFDAIINPYYEREQVAYQEMYS